MKKTLMVELSVLLLALTTFFPVLACFSHVYVCRVIANSFCKVVLLPYVETCIVVLAYELLEKAEAYACC